MLSQNYQQNYTSKTTHCNKIRNFFLQTISSNDVQGVLFGAEPEILVKSQQQNAQNARPPVHYAHTTLPSSQCSKYNHSSQREAISQSINTFFMSSSSTQGPPSAYGSGDWTTAVFLDMSDTSQSCPSACNLVTTRVRSCGWRGSSFGVCDSVLCLTGHKYSSVCGRIITYLIGLARGFHNVFGYSLSGIDDTESH